MAQVLWLVAVAWASSTPADIPNPRTSNSWVSDTASVIDAPTQSRMNNRIDQLHQAHGIEIAVVTVGDVADTPKTFATELFNLWGIGDEQADDGLLILLVMDQRRLEMEVGYGLEGVLSDGWLGTMQAKDMVPHFKAGDHGVGLEVGLIAVANRLTESGDLSAARPQQTRSVGGWGKLALFVGSIAAILAPFFIAGALWSWRLRRKERGCPDCGIETVLLDEVADDAHLDAGQLAEEQLKSVDWRVRVCGECQGVRLFSSSRLFPRFVRCGGCGYRTGRESRITLDASTYTSSGTGWVSMTCVHCGHESSLLYTIPRRVRSSSSGGFGSGGGGGSFGGGSSGGGGAGSSW